MPPVTSFVSAPALKAQSDYRGRAFLYVLVAAGPEDLLKVGMTHDPLARWSAFHPRWFEAFDLEHSLLLETETRQDAQTLETQLHRMLVAHHCPMPITMRGQAGGGTEWYRGAYAAARRFIAARQSDGFVAHVSASAWLQAAMRDQQDRLEGLLQQARAYRMAGWLSPAQQRAMRDLIDAHVALNPDIAARLSTDALSDS